MATTAAAVLESSTLYICDPTSSALRAPSPFLRHLCFCLRAPPLPLPCAMTAVAQLSPNDMNLYSSSELEHFPCQRSQANRGVNGSTIRGIGDLRVGGRFSRPSLWPVQQYIMCVWWGAMCGCQRRIYGW